MALEIVWSEFAEKQLDEIFKYYSENANDKVAKKILQNIITAPDQLKNNPFLGQTEEFLKERKISYRYLLHKNYKIIYSVDQEKESIRIADVFDTRQDAMKLRRGK